jgi:hypothetical protein
MKNSKKLIVSIVLIFSMFSMAFSQNHDQIGVVTIGDQGISIYENPADNEWTSISFNDGVSEIAGFSTKALSQVYTTKLQAGPVEGKRSILGIYAQSPLDGISQINMFVLEGGASVGTINMQQNDGISRIDISSNSTSFSGNVSMYNQLSVQEGISTDSLAVSGAVTLSDTATLNGPVVVSDTLSVEGDSYLNGLVVLSDAIAVDGSAVFGSRVNITRLPTLELFNDSITVIGSNYKIDTQGLSPADSLTNIIGGTQGQILILSTTAASRDVNVVNGGNIRIGTDINLNTPNARLTLIFDGGKWFKISFSEN